MDIKNDTKAIPFSKVQAGQVFRLEKGHTLYMKLFDFLGVDAVHIEKGTSYRVDYDKQVVIVHGAFVVENAYGH